MLTGSGHMDTGIIDQNLTYYDGIADAYDAILDKDVLNQVARKKVAEFFCRLIPSGQVLDFGGGTGKDLPWLLEKGYRIIFCEPSTKMREKAIALSSKYENHILFLSDTTADFRTWRYQLPFQGQVSGGLANFAVLNCIPALPVLFENLSLVIRPGGHLVLLVLQAGFRKRFKTNREAALISLFTGETVTGSVHFQQQQQTIYLHTITRIKKDAAPWFRFGSHTDIKENNFVLIHLVRK
jgi:SAM-dependent methyltransferase